MGFTAFPESVRAGVERAVDAHEVSILQPGPHVQRRRVRRLLGAEAAVAAAVVGGTDRPATRVGDRPKARRAVRDHYAHRPTTLALDAHAVRPHPWTPTVQVGADHLEQLLLVDRASLQLVVNMNVRADRGGG